MYLYKYEIILNIDNYNYTTLILYLELFRNLVSAYYVCFQVHALHVMVRCVCVFVIVHVFHIYIHHVCAYLYVLMNII